MSTTEFEKAAERARKLTNTQLADALKRYDQGPVAGAVRVEMARRRVQEQKNAARLALFR